MTFHCLHETRVGWPEPHSPCLGVAGLSIFKIVILLVKPDGSTGVTGTEPTTEPTTEPLLDKSYWSEKTLIDNLLLLLLNVQCDICRLGAEVAGKPGQPARSLMRQIHLPSYRVLFLCDQYGSSNSSSLPFKTFSDPPQFPLGDVSFFNLFKFISTIRKPIP